MISNNGLCRYNSSVTSVIERTQLQPSSMHILFVSPYYKPAYVHGGPVQVIASLAEEFARMGCEVTVFTTNENGGKLLDMPVNQPVAVNGVNVLYFPLFLHGLHYSFSPLLEAAILARIRGFNIVVVHSLWEHQLQSVAKACIRFKVPFVITVHGQLFPWALARKKLKKNIYLALLGRNYINRANAIQCTDPVEANAVTKLGFRPPTFVVPNAIRSCEFTGKQASSFFRQQFGIPNHAYVLLILGRLTQIKRPDIAIDVVAAAQSLNSEIHLIIAGPDEDGMIYNLQHQARNLGCNDKVHFTGLLKKDDVINALSESNLLLMPSEIQENFGMAAIEALASGIPILVSEGIPVGLCAQEVGAGRISACTSAAFQKAALELLTKPEQLKIMGQLGQELVQKNFDISVIARKMLMQYQAIVTLGKPLLEAKD